MSRIVVTGGGGQVGRALGRLAPDMALLDRAHLDVTDRAEVRSVLEASDVVVHLAAMTAVDGCEEDPNSATRVNVEGTRNVVVAAAQTGTRVIFLSTDYVFDGRKDEPYVEGDEPHPLNVYGRTKLEGERIVAGSPGSLTLRASWVFGEGSNFIRTILRAASTREELQVVDDQVGRPTAAADIASAILEAVHGGISGLIHFTGEGVPGSWADLAEYVLALTGSKTNVTRVDSDTYARGSSRPIAIRPSNSVLALDRAREAGLPLHDWRERVAAYVADLGGRRR